MIIVIILGDISIFRYFVQKWQIIIRAPARGGSPARVALGLRPRRWGEPGPGQGIEAAAAVAAVGSQWVGSCARAGGLLGPATPDSASPEHGGCRGTRGSRGVWCAAGGTEEHHYPARPPPLTRALGGPTMTHWRARVDVTWSNRVLGARACEWRLLRASGWGGLLLLVPPLPHPASDRPRAGVGRAVPHQSPPQLRRPFSGVFCRFHCPF